MTCADWTSRFLLSWLQMPFSTPVLVEWLFHDHPNPLPCMIGACRQPPIFPCLCPLPPSSDLAHLCFRQWTSIGWSSATTIGDRSSRIVYVLVLAAIECLFLISSNVILLLLQTRGTNCPVEHRTNHGRPITSRIESFQQLSCSWSGNWSWRRICRYGCMRQASVQRGQKSPPLRRFSARFCLVFAVTMRVCRSGC